MVARALIGATSPTGSSAVITNLPASVTLFPYTTLFRSQKHDGTLTIAKALITVAANNAAMTYGDSIPAVGYTYKGYPHGNTASGIRGTTTCSTAATCSSNAGSYATTCNISGLSASSYAF